MFEVCGSRRGDSSCKRSLCLIETTISSTPVMSPINCLSQTMQRLCKGFSSPHRNGESSTMRQNVSQTLEVSRLELYRVSTCVDLQAWAIFQQSLEETVLSWFHEHPGEETACRLQSDWCTCVRP